MHSTEQLLGVWDLTSIYSVNPSGHKQFHFGEDAVGRLIYRADGYMNVFIMDQNRAELDDSDIYNETPENIRKIYDGFDSYCGKYSVDFSEGIITHHVDMARATEWVGNDHVRYFTVDGNKLSIYTPPLLFDNDEWVVYANWQKNPVS